MAADGERLNWSYVRPFVFLGAISLLAIILVQAAFAHFTDPQLSLGCAPKVFGNMDPTETVAIWNDREIVPPQSLSSLSVSPPGREVLGSTTGNKWIEIDLAAQKLIAHDGDKVFLETPISSGLYNQTPVGEYHLLLKSRSVKIEGGSRLRSNYFYLPNVPYAMYFTQDFGILGAYWQSEFGSPIGHGCIHTPVSQAQKLFSWVDPQIATDSAWISSSDTTPGTRVVVHN